MQDKLAGPYLAAKLLLEQNLYILLIVDNHDVHVVEVPD
jgi:hypothetical protein